jgi:hypothetical protein
MKTQLDLPDAARDQLFLLRADHAHGNVGLAPQQVLHAVGQHQLDLQRRVRLAQPRDDGRQHLDADHFAGGDAHDAPIFPPPSPWLVAARSSEAAVLSIASAWPCNASATSVGISPTCERVNSTTPSAASSAATWRPAVGWVMPSARAAPESEPSRRTPRNERYSSQPMFEVIRKCIAAV